MGEDMIKELLAIAPEDAPIIQECISKNNHSALVHILSDRARSCMDPQLFIEALEAGDTEKVLAVSRKALKMRNLMFQIAALAI